MPPDKATNATDHTVDYMTQASHLSFAMYTARACERDCVRRSQRCTYTILKDVTKITGGLIALCVVRARHISGSGTTPEYDIMRS